MTAPHVIVGTAGHVDHGKTALVKALTGTDTDTQPEERARGVTIDVGFAYWRDHVTVVDVPGHERFVKNAVTGASAIDLALFVVAADDGVMPQTREHLAILELLGIGRGVVALTKIDLVEPEWAELVAEELRELFAGTFLESAPILPVSAITGQGVDALREAMEGAIAAVGPRPAGGAFRLPVDRAFSMAGFGTVVTGTVLAGRVHPRDELVLQPAGRPVRVRGLQVHGADRDEAGAGLRAAINLSDVELEQVTRGDTLVAAGTFPATSMLDARLEIVADAGLKLTHRDRVRLHLGAGELLARVVLLDAETLGPGDSGYVQLRLESPAVAAHGDRFVIRRYSPARTLGGGVILDPAPAKHRRRRPGVLEALRALDTDSAETAALAFLGAAGPQGRTADELAQPLGATPDEAEAWLRAWVEAGRAVDLRGHGTARYLAADAWAALERDLADSLEAYHRAEPLKPGLGREALQQRVARDCPAPVFQAVLERLAAAGRVRLEGALVSSADHRVELSPDLEDLGARLADLLRDSGAQPPDAADLPTRLGVPAADAAAVVEVLRDRGEVLRLADGLLFHRDVLETLRAELLHYLQRHGQVEVSAFRELAGTTRKYAVPLLNHFDATGVTRRDGSVRRLAG